jgi:hypothetical protein
MAVTRDLALDMDWVRIYSFHRLERHSAQGCDEQRMKEAAETDVRSPGDGL